MLGCDVGPSESREFWTGCLRDLAAPGLSGVPLVIRDAHRGLVVAVHTVFLVS